MPLSTVSPSRPGAAGVNGVELAPFGNGANYTGGGYPAQPHLPMMRPTLPRGRYPSPPMARPAGLHDDDTPGGRAGSFYGRLLSHGGPRPFPQEPGGPDSTLYRMQPVLNSPANGHLVDPHVNRPAPHLGMMRQLPQGAAAHHHPHPAVDKATEKTIKSAVELRRIEHTIGGILYLGTRGTGVGGGGGGGGGDASATGPRHPSPLHPPGVAAAGGAGAASSPATSPASGPVRPPLEEGAAVSPHSPVFGAGGGFAASEPSYQHTSYHQPAYVPGSPTGYTPYSPTHHTASPRRMEELARAWQQRANDVESRLRQHQSDLNMRKAQADRVLAAARPSDAPGSMPGAHHGSPLPYGGRPESPASVVPENLAAPVDDAVQQQLVAALNAFRESLGVAGGVAYGPSMKGLAQQAADELLAGQPQTSDSTTQHGAQGQLYYVVEGAASPESTLAQALAEWGADASHPAQLQALAAPLKEVGFGFAASPGGCVLVVNLHPKA